jgi:hypothetical protein
MTERVSAKEIGRRRSRNEADQLVRDFEASGLERREFCERHAIALNTFNRYVQRYRAKGAAAGNGPQLVAVEVVNPVAFRAEVVIVLPQGRRVEVARGFDAGTLQQVVTALERH